MVYSDVTRGMALNWKRAELDIRKKFFVVRAVRYCNRFTARL